MYDTLRDALVVESVNLLSSVRIIQGKRATCTGMHPSDQEEQLNICRQSKSKGKAHVSVLSTLAPKIVWMKPSPPCISTTLWESWSSFLEGVAASLAAAAICEGPGAGIPGAMIEVV